VNDKHKDKPLDADTRKELLELYKLQVEMADRVSGRRQAANNFYLSVNTLLVGGTAALARIGLGQWNVVVIALAGLAISALWVRSIGSYASLNDGKFAVITELEAELAAQPFTREWEALHSPERRDADGKKRKKHRPFHTVEVVVPWVFFALYVIQIAVNVPWERIIPHGR
jgi:hypothetical protein